MRSVTLGGRPEKFVQLLAADAETDTSEPVPDFPEEVPVVLQKMGVEDNEQGQTQDSTAWNGRVDISTEVDTLVWLCNWFLSSVISVESWKAKTAGSADKRPHILEIATVDDVAFLVLIFRNYMASTLL